MQKNPPCSLVYKIANNVARTFCKGKKTESWNPGIQWNITESHGIPRNLMESHGIMEFNGIQ